MLDHAPVRAWRFVAFHPCSSVENGGLLEKPLHSRVMLCGRIERRHERSPLLGGQADPGALGQNLLRGAHRTINHKLPDRRVRSRAASCSARFSSGETRISSLSVRCAGVGIVFSIERLFLI